jgi:hypothetical protein
MTRSRFRYLFISEANKYPNQELSGLVPLPSVVVVVVEEVAKAEDDFAVSAPNERPPLDILPSHTRPEGRQGSGTHLAS